jgi:metallo-beta-lactamase class B
MTRTRRVSGWFALSLSVSGLSAAQETPNGAARPDSVRVIEIVNRARSAAGSEWTEAVEFLCGRDSARPNRPNDPELTPTRVFDNLYALGRTSTVVWAITTPDGIILIDAGYPDQLESVLLPGLRKLGLDPNAVKYVLLGHGHADHFGGTSYFQQRGARVVLSDADWGLIENPTLPAPGTASTAPTLAPPKRDVVAADGQPIEFGGTVITPVLIPGHTPGALGFVFDVKDGDRTHTAALFGGSILLAARISDEGLEQYLRSIEHFAEVTSERRVAVEIQNHPLYDGFMAKRELLEQRAAGAAHPFVVGAPAYQRFLTVMAECTRAELERRGP